MMVRWYGMYDIIESPHNDRCTHVCQTPNPWVLFTSKLGIFAFSSVFFFHLVCDPLLGAASFEFFWWICVLLLFLPQEKLGITPSELVSCAGVTVWWFKKCRWVTRPLCFSNLLFLLWPLHHILEKPEWSRFHVKPPNSYTNISKYCAQIIWQANPHSNP